MLDAVKRYLGGRVLEVGVGSGHVLKELVGGCFWLVASDIDRRALKETFHRIVDTGFSQKIDLVCCDGASVFRESVFDLIVFNPPYLHSEGFMDRAVDGGVRGVQVLLRVLKQAVKALRPKGRIIFLLSSLSNHRSVSWWLERSGFKVKEVKRRRLFFEEIFVFEAEAQDEADYL